ncbi:hypothetical protein P3W85_31200 [Cupriavidus basilensis]|uniref:Uncharacterized protein n=1 Tax=Cupriavidus basilensis TaxID=68895 RepID=A0ABT6AXP8_9BURK|nr:hypothetical protein [Cupriavidus basilensis]MDF3837382.1 hypothetical protein [Cupriavidus basilensis]
MLRDHREHHAVRVAGNRPDLRSRAERLHAGAGIGMRRNQEDIRRRVAGYSPVRAVVVGENGTQAEHGPVLQRTARRAPAGNAEHGRRARYARLEQHHAGTLARIDAPQLYIAGVVVGVQALDPRAQAHQESFLFPDIASDFGKVDGDQFFLVFNDAEHAPAKGAGQHQRQWNDAEQRETQLPLRAGKAADRTAFHERCR